jgi:hypothetical protein
MDSELEIPAETPVTGALVVLEEGRSGHFGPCPRPRAGFLAQLLACSDGTPAYRARRRTEPTDASACYNTGAAGPDASRFERIL